MLQRVKTILNDKSGLTAIQKLMLIVCTITLIVVSIFAFRGYTQSAYQVKANATARDFFNAATEYISLQKSMGSLDALNHKATYFGKAIDLERRKDIYRSRYQGADFDSFFADYEQKYKNVEIRYIYMSPTDDVDSNRKDNPILAMLENKILDANIKKHTFLLEYNTHTGQVLAVFYSEKANKYVYDDNYKDMSNVIIRDSKSLEDKWQGYFGLEVEEL